MPYACWFLWQVDWIEDFKWCLHFQFAFRRVVLREVYIWRPRSRLKGMEKDFSLEHWAECSTLHKPHKWSSCSTWATTLDPQRAMIPSRSAEIYQEKTQNLESVLQLFDSSSELLLVSLGGTTAWCHRTTLLDCIECWGTYQDRPHSIIHKDHIHSRIYSPP